MELWSDKAEPNFEKVRSAGCDRLERTLQPVGSPVSTGFWEISCSTDNPVCAIITGRIARATSHEDAN